jgi:PAS domain S-box-containing protein
MTEKTAHILIVEDDISVRRTFGLYAKSDGYQVQEVASANEAVQLLSLRSFDLVITDISMKGKNGIELTKHIVQNFPTVPVIVITGQEDPQIINSAIEAGASNIFFKPTSRAQFLLAIHSLIEKKHFQQELQSLQKGTQVVDEIFDHISQDSSLIIAVYDEISHSITYYGRSLFHLLGYDPKDWQWLQDEFNNGNYPIAHPHDLEIIRNVFTPETLPIEVEYRLRDKQDNWQWIRTIVTPFRRDRRDNSVTAYLQVYENINERKSQHERLQSFEANLKALMDNNLNAIFSINRNFEILTFNNVAASSMEMDYGITLEQGKNLLSLIRATTAPEDMLPFQSNLEAAFSGTVVTTDQTVQRNGKELILEVSFYPMYTRGNIVVSGVACFTRDVTESKNIEKELQEFNTRLEERVEEQVQSRKINEERFKNIFAEAPIGMIEMIYKDNKFKRFYNKEFLKIVGYSIEEFLQISDEQLQQLNDPEDAAIENPLFKDLIAGKRSKYTLEQKLFRKNGDVATVKVTATSIRSEDGSLANIIYLIDDISERKAAEKALRQQKERLEEQTIEIQYINEELQRRNGKLADANAQLYNSNRRLEELNREKNEFLGIASHDMKNPLTSILMKVQTIERYHEKLGKEKLLKQVHSIGDTAQRMNEIITHFLDINNIESKIQSLELSPTDIPSLVASVVLDFTERATKKSIDLVLSDESEEGIVLAHRTSVYQIIENLLSNAIKFSEKDSRIWILVQNLPKESNEKDSDFIPPRIRISVRDEGPGIDSADMQKLFGRFQKLSARPTAGESSSGLGLSIVKKLVETMKGSVWAESTLGKGTTFLVDFPLLTESKGQ